MKTIQNWVKGGLLIALIPCVMMGAIVVGIVFRALGVKVEDK